MGIIVKTFHLSEFGYTVEIDKYARQAGGAVLLRKGNTVILSTVVSAPSKEFPGFLPLTVEYREQFSAAGKIPGGYYKREGKSSDKEVLTARLIDRAIRPLFPEDYFNQIQAVTTVYSVDKEHAPRALGLLATSLALTLSRLPFLGPVGVVDVARIDGNWIVNPNYTESKKADSYLIIAGTHEGICMVEGSSAGLQEEDLVDILFVAHEKIKKLVAWQEEIATELAVAPPQHEDLYNWSMWKKRADDCLTPECIKKGYIANKIERKAYFDHVKAEFISSYEEDVIEKKIPEKVVEYIFELALTKKITDYIFAVGSRIDGRSFDQVRDISVEVDLLPSTHGSALFSRGNTQALVSLTLGGGQDEQRIESIMEKDIENSSFMLHYNFPPFSVGEVRPMRGPGRREVGHGYLAASALRSSLPTKEEFSYTIRLVSDILESDGSSSMATVCGATMALMGGGVPIKAMVGGIAMGLLRSENNEFIVLSDISGFEDAFGLMDFKVAGTDKFITAIQMDIKHKGGLSRDVFELAMKRAKIGRKHILEEMRKIMDHPKDELSDLVPKLVSFRVDTDKIGAIIGGGGKTIREIVDKTGTNIDIDPDGLVKILGGEDAKLDVAVNWVKTLAGQIKSGAIYRGQIRKVAEFGLFVELVPGQDGLVHVSALPRTQQRNFSSLYTVGDIVSVEVVEYDTRTGRVRLRLIEEE